MVSVILKYKIFVADVVLAVAEVDVVVMVDVVVDVVVVAKYCKPLQLATRIVVAVRYLRW